MQRAWWLVMAGVAAGAAWALDPPRPAPAPQPSQPATQQPAKSAPAAEPAPVPAATDAEQPTTEAPEEEETLPPLPPEVRRTGPTPQRFDPSEEVRADFPVSFPVDI